MDRPIFPFLWMRGEDEATLRREIGKIGASGGHLDPKKQGRTMCELFGAYGCTNGGSPRPTPSNLRVSRRGGTSSSRRSQPRPRGIR